MGVGAKEIALAGAVTAGSDDIHSAYWNPAGLAEMETSEASLSGQPTGKLLPINFIGIGTTVDWLGFAGLKTGIAFSWIPRLYVKASGAFTSNEFESIFLRFALPDLPGNFDGTISSKTKDFRISWAIMPENDPGWSFGMSVTRIDCGTQFCGVRATNPGQYIIESTKATAYGVNIGGKLFINKDFTLGFNLKDIDTKLDIGIHTTYPNGTTTYSVYRVAYPRDLTFGAHWRYSSHLNLMADFQSLFGKFGSYKMNFRILRTGAEYLAGALRYRAGLLIPLKISADKVGDLGKKLPAPFLPTLGMGVTQPAFDFDLALYPQPVMSAQRKRLYPALDATLTGRF